MRAILSLQSLMHDPEKAMATQSSTLAWEIPWMEEPGRLQSVGSRRVGHDWATSLSLFTFTHWRRKWQASVLVCRIPGMGEPGGLPSMGSHRVGHDWSDLASVAACMTIFPPCHSTTTSRQAHLLELSFCAMRFYWFTLTGDATLWSLKLPTWGGS